MTSLCNAIRCKLSYLFWEMHVSILMFLTLSCKSASFQNFMKKFTLCVESENAKKIINPGHEKYTHLKKNFILD